MLQCAHLLYLSLKCFGRLSLMVNHCSSTSALASWGQGCPWHGFLGCHDHHCLLHMRLWALAWALGLVQKVDVDRWALWPHNIYIYIYVSNNLLKRSNFFFLECMIYLFICILFFVNIMKQNLYAFLQIYVYLNLSFIFLQNISLCKIYSFWVTLSLFFFFDII